MELSLTHHHVKPIDQVNNDDNDPIVDVSNDFDTDTPVKTNFSIEP